MEIQHKIISTGAAFIFILISGFILSKIGKPYNPLFFNIHKLISLGVLIYAIVITVQIFKCAEVYNPVYYILLIIILLSIAAFITGGILSAKDNAKEIILTIHRIVSLLILAGVVILIFLQAAN